LAYFTTKLIT